MPRKTKMLKVDQESQKEHIRLALYVRVSTDAQAEEGYSIDFQKEKLQAYSKSMPLVPEDVTFFVDDGYSGGSLERPQMQKMINEIEKNNITHVIVYKLDRLSRSQKDTLHLIEDIFIPHNIAFISISESFNTATPFGRAVIGILSVFAQLERENIYERTRNGMLKRIENGYWIGGGTTPFGYDYDKEKGILVKNDDAKIVEKLYELYLKGYSKQRLAQLFNLKYDRLVHQILMRKSNYGVIEYRGKEYKGLHEPIISKDVYDKTMLMMEERALKKQTQVVSDHLLTGLIKCGVCGAKMRYMNWGKDKQKIICYSKMKSKPYLVKDKNCNNEYFDVCNIEKIVIADVFRVTSDVIFNKENKPNTQSTIDILKNKINNCNKKLERLYTLFSESDSENDNSLLLKIKELRQEKDVLQKQIDNEEKTSLIAKTKKQTQNQLYHLEEKWGSMSVEEKRKVLKSLIKEVILAHDNVQIIYDF